MGTYTPAAGTAIEEQPVAGPGPSSEAAAVAGALAAGAHSRVNGHLGKLNGLARQRSLEEHSTATPSHMHSEQGQSAAAASSGRTSTAPPLVHNGDAGQIPKVNGAVAPSPLQAAIEAGVIRPFFAADEPDAAANSDAQHPNGAADWNSWHSRNSVAGADKEEAAAAAAADGVLLAEAAVPSEAEALAAVGLDAASLPPFGGAGTRGAVFTDQELTVKSDWERTTVLAANRSQMLLTFLGTSAGMGTPGFNAPAIALVRANDAWLFDAGEDTQRQLFKANHLKPSKLVRIFISSRSPERLLGLPGLICTLSSAREKGHEVSDIPIHIYGPSGVAEFLASMFQVSDTFIECPVVVHEFALGPVEPEDVDPSLFNRRAKIYRSFLPPDQLNPDGWINTGLDSFMPTQGRAKREKGLRASGGVMAHDARAGFTAPPLPSPGSPDARVAPGDMTWTLKMDIMATVTAALVSDGRPARRRRGVLWFRRRRGSGNLSVERAQALKLNDRSVYASLKDGHPAVNEDGVLIPSSLVVSPDKPGRRLAIVPQPCTSQGLETLLRGVDVLVAGVGVQGAADVARRVRARNVLISGLDADDDRANEAASATSGAASSPHPEMQEDAGQGALSNGTSALSSGALAAAAGLHPPSDGAVAADAGAVQQLLEPVQAALPPGGRALAARDLLSVVVSKHEGSGDVPDLAAAVRECVTVALHMQTPRMTPAEKAAARKRDVGARGRRDGRGGRDARDSRRGR